MFADLRTRLRALFRRDAVEVELDDELRFHFDKQVEKYVTSGLPRAEAMRRARLEFGGTDAVKEECREARGVHFLEIAAQDHPGLLYEIGSALARLGCNIEVALIDTEGEKVIDVFYLTEQGKKLGNRKQELLKEVLMGTLG